jgi:outer membrane protein TolC
MSEKEYSVASVETLINNAVKERNDINIARLEHSSLKDAHEVEKNNILPSVQAFGKIQTDSYQMTYMPDHYTIGLQLTMNFLDPARSQS